jgi:phosphoenolpyruvate carboxykinase (ATP)
VIFFLTADASGVLPPVARLTPSQAMYHFISGYTSKLAGTERGLGAEPQATFSTCFSAPFIPLPPTTYARLLGEKLAQHRAQVWLVNTGWTGGPFGVGERIPLPYTRAIVHAAIRGDLDKTPTRTEPYFGLEVPVACPGVPEGLLDPRSTWPEAETYDGRARSLAAQFRDNFTQFARLVSEEIAAGGPPPPD